MSNKNEPDHVSDWPKESIPDADTLFRRVHRQHAPDGEIQPGAFVDVGPGMSTNWQKYCPTPQDSKKKGKQPNNPAFGVVSLPVGGLRRVPLGVDHTPTRKDRSHTTVVGDKTAEVREKLTRLARWELRPEDSGPK